MNNNNLNWRAFRYALSIFMIIIFFWWFVTGADIFQVSNNPVPAEKFLAIVSESFKLGFQSVINFLGF